MDMKCVWSIDGACMDMKSLNGLLVEQELELQLSQ